MSPDSPVTSTEPTTRTSNPTFSFGSGANAAYTSASTIQGTDVPGGTGWRRYLLTAVSLVVFAGLATHNVTADQAAQIKSGAQDALNASQVLYDYGLLLLGIAAHFFPGLYRLGFKRS